VGAALDRGDRVGEGKDVFLVGRVPLQGDLEGEVILLILEAHDGGVEGRLLLVQVLDVIDEAVRVVEDDGALRRGFRWRGSRFIVFQLLVNLVEGEAISLEESFIGLEGGLFLRGNDVLPLIRQLDVDALVEEGHLLEAIGNRLVVELDGFKNLGVRPETNLRAGAAGLAALFQVVRNLVVKALVPVVAVALNVRLDAGGQGVDHGNTDTVEAAGDLVGIVVELAASVELGHDDFHRGAAGLVHLDGDATTVVGHLDGAVLVKYDVHLVRIAGQGFVDRVIDDLPHQVVQATRPGRTDVHTGALAHSFQTLQHGNRRCVVIVMFWAQVLL